MTRSALIPKRVSLRALIGLALIAAGVVAAVVAVLSPTSLVFDGRGQRLVVSNGELRASPTDPDGSEELADLLRNWLGYMDAIRWSVADTPLPDLLEQCLDHAAACGLYR